MITSILSDLPLHTLLESSPAYLVAVKDGIHVDCSQGFANLFGYQRQEIIGTTMDFIIHPQDLEYTASVIKSAMQSKLSLNVKIRCKHKDGNLFPMNFHQVLTHEDVLLSVGMVVESSAVAPTSEAAELIQLAVDTTTHGLFSYVPRNDVFYCNSFLLELLHKSQLNTLQDFVDCFSSPSPDELLQILSTIQELQFPSQTFRVVMSDATFGKKIFELGLSTRVVSVSDFKILGTLRDITESEMQQQSIKEQLQAKNILLKEISEKESSLRFLTNELEETQRLAKMGYFRLDCETNLLYVSPSLQNLVHFITDAFNVTSLDTLLDLVPVDFQSKLSSTILDAITGNHSFSIDFPIQRTTSNAYLVMRAHPSSINVHGKVRTLFGSIQDITDIRKMELALEKAHNRLEAVINTVLDGIIVFENNDVVMTNDSMKNIPIVTTSLLKEGTQRSSVITSILDNCTESSEELKSSLELNAFRGEMKCTDVRYYDLYSIIVTEGSITRNVLTLRDITHLKQVQNELMKASEVAKSADKAKSNFLAMTSHELRSPLSGILGMISVLKETPLSTEQSEMVNIVENSGTLLLSLINDILDFSKIEAGSMILTPERFKLINVLVDEPILILRCSPSRKKKLLTFVLFADPCLDVEVFADGLRLRQILLNLLSNAHKFTQQGYVALEMQCLKREGNKLTIHVLIKDTGCGIEKERIDRLFDPFVQSRSTLASSEGTGLGLPISQRLLNLFGSKLQIKSDLSVGSEFSFDITIEITQELETKFVVPSKPILLCIRNSMTRHFLVKQITAFGITVVNFSSVSKILPSNYSVVMVEYGHESGVDLVLSVSETSPSPRPATILLCDCAEDTQPTSDLKAKFSRFFSLPITFSELKSFFTKEAFRTNEAALPPIQEKILAPDGSHFNVLLCDDNQINLRTSQLILTSLGLDVTPVNDGSEAVTYYCNTPTAYDVVFLDYHMPTPGPIASKRIRHFEEQLGLPRVLIFGLTADVLTETRDDCLQSGMDDVIQKPFTKATINTVLQRTLTRKSRRRGSLPS
ncbi:hypothetical protein RCL1_005166 [Eukaryota sp. TZLM3-RCL]